MGGLVHIVDDDELVRAKISHLLSNHGYSTEIYGGGAEFFRDCSLQRGCIFLDLRMPQMSGYEVLEELGRLGSILPVVVMTAHGNIPAVVRAMKLGAVDFIEKPASEEDLPAVVDRALNLFGKTAARRKAAHRLACLTPRQRQVVQGLLDGLSNKAIARRLGPCPRTIEAHRANLMAVLGATSLSEIVRLAMDAAMVPTREPERPEAPVANCLLQA
jgi:two-component system response regulator FixJ